jgi:FkbM family methyltransferase
VQLLARRLAARTMLGRLPGFEARYPDGRIFAVARHDTMYSPIFFYGEYEPAESAVIRALLSPGDFAVDVGAHRGWFSVLMARAVSPGGSVLAVEPLASTRAHLARNLRLNPDLVVRVAPVALGASEGETTIYLFRGLPDGHASAAAFGRDDARGHVVARRSLDGLLADAGQRPPALIKLDVEGSELDVLRGASRTLASDRPPALIVEVNRQTASAFGYAPAALVEELRRVHPYSVDRIAAGGLSPELDLEGADAVTWALLPEHLAPKATALRAHRQAAHGRTSAPAP